MGNGVGSTSLDNLGGILNWSWTNELSYLWNCNWVNWRNWEGIGGNTETTTISNILDAHFLSLRVNVGVASADVSGSITDGGMCLTWVGISVACLA